MNKKIILFLLAIVTIALVVFVFTKRSNLETEREYKYQDRKFIEVSEVEKNDINFYKISIASDSNSSNISKKFKNLNHVVNSYFQSIKEIISVKHPNIEKLDKAMHALLMSNDISRINKINGLWLMLNEVGFLSERSEYLLDALSTLMPIELTDKLITVYNDSGNLNIKVKLINMLANNINIANPEVQDKERLDFIIEKIKEIQSFLKENVLHENNPEIVSEAIHAYADVSDEEDVQELIVSLKEGENAGVLKEKDIVNLLAEVAVSTEEAQKEMLPAMLETMTNSNMLDTQQKENFTKMLIESINAGVLTQETQQEVSSYLKKQEPELTLKEKVSTDTMAKYYTWAEANTKIKNNNVNLESIALENDNPLKVSSILLYADDSTIQKIKASPNTDNLYVKLESALEDDKITNENKVIIKDAMSRLDNIDLKQKDNK